MEPMRGFEPPSTSYKDAVLPLNYIGLVVAAGVAPACNCVSDSRLAGWLHHIAATAGIEPAPNRVTAGRLTARLHGNEMVDRTGFEPVPRRCKRHMLPLTLVAHDQCTTPPVPVQGLEPQSDGSEPPVLPLHQTGTDGGATGNRTPVFASTVRHLGR